MQREIAIALRATVATLVLTGILYPLAMTGVALLVAPAQAGGSLVRDENGGVIGSALIAQPFTKPGYLWPRPSAAGTGYDAAASSGSNLGTTSQKLHDRAAAELARLRAANPDASDPVPAELVAASASGLDPHLSPAAALWQAPRVARARNVEESRVRAVIEGQIEPRALGFLGEPRVNVLLLNLALDRQFGRPTS
jgi:K+-transporting ATPase ATPase C chain